MSALHTLKTWPEPFAAIKAGSKTFEFRRNDRNFEPGDRVLLREWDRDNGTYTGRRMFAEIGFVLRPSRGAYNVGLPDEYVVFSLLHVGPSREL